MNDAGSNLDQDGSSSFLQTLKIFAVGLASALHTRLDLFVTELEEERERLKQALILVVLVIFGLAFGFALINIFLVALFWEHGWIAAIGILALLYFGIAVGAALKLRSAILRRSGLFPATLAELQMLLEAFAHAYNTQRPHRSLPHRATPATIYTTRPKATPTPGARAGDSHDRVRRDKVDDSGVVTLRVGDRLHHIGVGRAHARTHVILLIHDLHVRIVTAATGELLRELTINPDKDYQPTGKQTGRPTSK